jgi:hypothetical protein
LTSVSTPSRSPEKIAPEKPEGGPNEITGIWD